jgi:hypothetical protein
MMMRADASSGRSDTVSSALSKADSPAGGGTVIASMPADPPSGADGKAEMRTVTTFLASGDCTVWMALPA